MPEYKRAVVAASVQNLTTSGTAAPSLAIQPTQAPDLTVRLATTEDAYYNVIPKRQGSFTLNPAGAGNTAAIDANASAADIQAALVAKLGAAKTTVTGTGTAADPFRVTFVGTLGDAAQTLTKVSTGIVNATLAVAEVTAGDGTHNEVFSLIFTAASVVTATTGVVLPGGWVEEIKVQPGDVITALQVTTAGVFSIAVLEA